MKNHSILPSKVKLGFLFTLTLLSLTQVFGQQSKLRGQIAIQNSQFDKGKVEYLQFVEVDENSQPRKGHALTDAQGQWTMELVGIPEKEPVFLKVSKEGWQVVNPDALQATAGQTATLRLYMATNKYITDAKRRYYNTGYTEAEKNLNQKIAAKEKEIEAMRQQSGYSEQQLQTLQEAYGQLQSQYEKFDAMARELSDKYARVNLDDAGQLYQDAFRLFQAGDLDAAMQLWQNANLSKQVTEILVEETRLGALKTELAERDALKNRRKSELTQNLQLKADAHRLRLEWDSVQTIYLELVRLDTTNFEILRAFSEFLADQNQTIEAIRYAEKARAYARTKREKAVMCGILADAYSKIQQVSKAEQFYLQAIKIIKELPPNDAVQYQLDLSGSLMHLGNFYTQQQRLQEAKQLILQVIELMEVLAQKNPEQAEPNLCKARINLSYFYISTKAFPEAEKELLLALSIVERLSKQDPVQYEPMLSTVFLNLGSCYINLRQVGKAEEAYVSALTIYEKLAKANPAQYEPGLAGRVMNLGIFYWSTGEMEQAEKMYLRALDIQERLVKNNAAQFEPDLSALVMNMGALYAMSDRMPASEAMFQRCLEIRTRLAERNPEQYESELVEALENFGEFYRINQRLDEAEASYRRSVEIMERLAKRNAGQYELALAESLNSLAWCCLFVKKNKEAMALAERALALHPQLNPARANLAHSLLLEDNWAKAKTVYQSYLKNELDLVEAKTGLLSELSELEAAGISGSAIEKAKDWLQK